MFDYHYLILWGSFRGRFGDHFRVGDHFGVGINSGAVQITANLSSEKDFCSKKVITLTFYLAQSVSVNQLWNSTPRPVLEGLEKFSHLETRSKISVLLLTELFYSHILNMNGGSLHTRSFERIHFSVFRSWWTKNGLREGHSNREHLTFFCVHFFFRQLRNTRLFLWSIVLHV